MVMVMVVVVVVSCSSDGDVGGSIIPFGDNHSSSSKL